VIRDGLAVLCLVLALSRWFAGAPAWVPAWAALLAGAALASMTRWPALRSCWPPPRPHLETAACLALALLYRGSALVHPWGWVNRDGAYGAFVALHLLAGERPAPVFTEGANYQGTLKAHLAAALALLTGDRDLSRLMAAASLLLSLVFIAASMALARRLAGRVAAAVTGLYLAAGPRFPTVFTLNCVGQYVEVLALGGLALALLARLLDRGDSGAPARAAYFGIGWLLGAAFWQQPVALAYAAAAAAALAIRGRTWRDPWTMVLPLGAAVGALPVLLWNLQHGWASGEILGRDAEGLRAQAAALPEAAALTARVSFPILAGLSPGHPWADAAPARALALAVIPAALLAFAALRGREALRSIRRLRPSPVLLPPLLALASLALFWAVAGGRVHWRPRYLLPVYAATAVHVGVALAALARRSRALAAAVLAPVLALNAAGYLPRLREAAEAQGYWTRVVRAIDDLGIRTGYADFSIAAPVTMFTAERILLSPRLGPTPAYYSPSQEARVASAGPDALVLRPRDDLRQFGDALTRLGVGYELATDPLPVFHRLTRRPRVEDVLAAWGRQADAEGEPE
jgi:hypothetical protein